MKLARTFSPYGLMFGSQITSLLDSGSRHGARHHDNMQILWGTEGNAADFAGCA